MKFRFRTIVINSPKENNLRLRNQYNVKIQLVFYLLTRARKPWSTFIIITHLTNKLKFT